MRRTKLGLIVSVFLRLQLHGWSSASESGTLAALEL